MNEQQRIFSTVFLCMGIWLGWQYFVGAPPQSPEPEIAAVTQAAPTTASVGVSGQPIVPAVAAHANGAVDPVERSFRTPLFAGAMRNGDAGLVSLNLLQFDERTRAETEAGAPKEPVSMVTPGGPGAHGAQAAIVWELDGPSAPVMDFVGPTGLLMGGTAQNGLVAQVEALPRDDAYAIDYVLRVTNPTTQPHKAGASVDLSLTPWAEQSSSFLAPPADPLHGLCEVRGSLERRHLKDLHKKPYVAAGPVAWAALDRQYFLTAIVPSELHEGQCSMQPAGDALALRFTFKGATLGPNEVWEQRFSLYAGPKRDHELAQVSEALKSTIDYTFLKVPLGFLARPMVFLLNTFFSWTTSWGVSIMLLTLTIKLLMFPVSYKSVLSMRRMQDLKPELDTIRTKYEHDKERQQMETLKLYRDRGVNPVGGCLPMLVQMPVWLTLYRTLWSAVDLYQQSFLWLPDLTGPEPRPILAALVALVTVLQQRLTPMAVDSQQARMMMYIMPVMFFSFMVYLPSGLVLYILTNSILTIFQQLVINSRATASPQKVPGR